MAVLRHPRLAHALMALRPGTRPLVDFICKDEADGLGPYLVEGSMVNPPTQAEVDAVTPTQLDNAAFDKSFRIVDETLLKVLFNHENRIRALEGRAAVTAAQFRDAVKTIARG